MSTTSKRVTSKRCYSRRRERPRPACDENRVERIQARGGFYSVQESSGTRIQLNRRISSSHLGPSFGRPTRIRPQGRPVCVSGKYSGRLERIPSSNGLWFSRFVLCLHDVPSRGVAPHDRERRRSRAAYSVAFELREDDTDRPLSFRTAGTIACVG